MAAITIIDRIAQFKTDFWASYSHLVLEEKNHNSFLRHKIETHSWIIMSLYKILNIAIVLNRAFFMIDAHLWVRGSFLIASMKYPEAQYTFYINYQK